MFEIKIAPRNWSSMVSFYLGIEIKFNDVCAFPDAFGLPAPVPVQSTLVPALLQPVVDSSPCLSIVFVTQHHARQLAG